MRLKLISPKDTLIGHIDVPDIWEEWFKRGGAASAAIAPRFAACAMMPSNVSPVIDIKTVTLVKAGWSQYPDAVYLREGSIEEMERLPGVSFSPSMAYLRSQLPEGGDK